MEKTSYHIHTLFCDGKSTPEEFVKIALKESYTSIGFSAHCMFPFSDIWHLDSKRINEYLNYVRNISVQMKENDIPLSVYAGFEADFVPELVKEDFSDYRAFSPDYIIGAVHFVRPGKKIFAVDDSLEVVKNESGSVSLEKKKTVVDYYSRLREMIKKSSFDVLAHFDLVKVHNKALELFDENDSWYREEVEKTVECLKQSGKICEINTGGIGRGKISELYPSQWIINLMFQAGIPLTLSTDSHNASGLSAGRDSGLEGIISAGYKEIMIIRDGEWVSSSLQE